LSCEIILDNVLKGHRVERIGWDLTYESKQEMFWMRNYGLEDIVFHLCRLRRLSVNLSKIFSILERMSLSFVLTTDISPESIYVILSMDYYTPTPWTIDSFPPSEHYIVSVPSPSTWHRRYDIF
jgi:hypothetical protein